MSRSVFTSRSAVLIMHAVFQDPSVVAVPCLRPESASERDGQCIPGLRSIRNNVRNESSGQSPTDVFSLAEHDDPTHAGASTYIGVTRMRGRADWRAVRRGGSVRISLGYYRSATAAAVAVAQWELEHPRDGPVRGVLGGGRGFDGPVRGVLGGFASPSESLSWGPNDSLQAIARALRVQSGASPPLANADERPGTPLPDLPGDFGSLPGDD